MHEERRKNGGLTDEQVKAIKDAVLGQIFEEIGRSIIKKVLWVGGACILALFAWLSGAGHIRFPGAE